MRLWAIIFFCARFSLLFLARFSSKTSLSATSLFPPFLSTLKFQKILLSLHTFFGHFSHLDSGPSLPPTSSTPAPHTSNITFLQRPYFYSIGTPSLIHFWTFSPFCPVIWEQQRDMCNATGWDERGGRWGGAEKERK